MSDSRDEQGSDEGQQIEWLRPRNAPSRPSASGLRGGLRQQSHGLRDRGPVTPALDQARARTSAGIRTPGAPAAPAAPAPVSAPILATARKLRRGAFEEQAGASDTAFTAPDPGVSTAPAARPGAPIKVVPPSTSAAQTRRLAHPLARSEPVWRSALRWTGRESRAFFVETARTVRGLEMPELHRPHWPLSRAATGGLSVGVAAVVAIVAGMTLLVPGNAVENPGAGSLNNVEFSPAAGVPTGDWNFGPYFAAADGRLLMMGSDGNTSFVWSSSDGSNWSKLTSPGAFDSANRRFVALGFAADRSGGFVAVGDSFVGNEKVTASAWQSRDGRQWRPAAVDFPANAEMIGLAAGNDVLVAGGNGVAWVSQDGSAWKMVALPGATGYVTRAVRAWSGGFTILGVWAGAGARRSIAWVSDGRGEHWVQAWMPLDLFNVEDAIGYGPGIVAVGGQTRSEAELATPTPKVSATPKSSAKATPKPTKTAAPSAVPSGSAGASGRPPSPTPSPTPKTFETAGSWSSPDGVRWFRGSTLAGRPSQSIVAVTQAFDSLVAVGAQPATLGAASPASRAMTLWVSDNGADWKPISASVKPLARSQLIQFGNSLLLAGIDTDGRLAVLTGRVTLGPPLPPLAATATPVFSLRLTAGSAPMIKGLTAQDTIGPVVGSGDRFFAFIGRKDGTNVYASKDGKEWTLHAKASDLLAGGAKGLPLVTAAEPDGQGGIVAVGSISGAEGDTAAVWHLVADRWQRSSVTSAGLTGLGSVAAFKGHVAAAAATTGGARIVASENGVTWVEASVPGSEGYIVSVSSYDGGFVAYGSPPPVPEDQPTPSAAPGSMPVWTSDDGLSWTRQTWTLPAHANSIVGVGGGFVATSSGITGKNSWWWSADGKAWREGGLTTVPGGCFGKTSAGLIQIAPPAAGSQDTSWTVWVSQDGHSWQRPKVDNLVFATNTCQVATVGQRVVVAGYQKAGVISDFFGQLGNY